jgi:hypothetical protein
MRLALPFLCLAAAGMPLSAQRPAVTTADYGRAEKFLAANLAGLAVGGSVTPNWLPDDRFWYRNSTQAGTEIVVIDPAKKTRNAYPDCAAAGVDCATEATAGGRGGGGRGGRGGGPQSSDNKPLSVSPDGTRAVFVRDWNLWLRDMKSGQERALTTDGVTYFGYATDNAGWSSSDRAMVAWSPDSKKIGTQQQDERHVGEMYLVNTTVGHPTLRVSKFPLPGDPVMAMLHRVIVDTETGTVTRLEMDPDFHRATLRVPELKLRPTTSSSLGRSSPARRRVGGRSRCTAGRRRRSRPDPCASTGNGSATCREARGPRTSRSRARRPARG